jgi:hypothetical protein
MPTINDANGTPAKVTDEGFLRTYAVNESEQLHVNEVEEEAYTMDIDGVQTDGANYWLAVIKNTSDSDMIITSITGFVPSFSNTQIYEAYVGSTFTYASNGTAVVPTNCNAGSGHSATGEFYVNDGGGNITTIVAGSIVGRFIFTTTATKWEKLSGWIIPKNGTFMLWSNLAEKLTGYISFYYHD